MVNRAEKLRLKRLLVEAISLLCRNGLPVHSSFRIEATIGITLSEDEVVLVSFEEVVQPDDAMVSEVNVGTEVGNEACYVQSDENFGCDAEPEMENIVHASQGSLSPAEMTDDEDPATLEETNIWNEKFPASGYSRKPKNRRISSKYGPSKLLLENLAVPDAKSPQIGSFLEGSLDDAKVRIKDEALDDGDCTFVKVEDVADDCLGTFESLEQDDSWTYQAYNEANIFSTGGHGLVQLAQGFNYSAYNAQAGLRSSSSANFSSREALKSAQRGRSNFVDEGTGAARSGVRQNLADSSRSQDQSLERTLQSLCKTLVDQTCSSTSSSGESVSCHICGARLSSHATLVKHIKGTHLAMSMCRCDICGQSFKWTMQLCRHRRRYHSKVFAK